MPIPDLEGAPTNPAEFISKKEAGVKYSAQKLVALYEAYKEFAANYPWLAEQGLRAFNIAAQSLIGGPVGFLNAVRGELTGEAVNLVAGEYIAEEAEAAIEAGAEQLMSTYKSLNKEEARISVAATGMLAAGILEGSAGIKQVLKHLDDKKMHKIESSKLKHDLETSDDVKLYASKLKLMDHEGGTHKGHTNNRHVGKDKDWLINRLNEEPNIRGSSSYKNLIEAEKVVKEIIHNQADDISKWLKDARIGDTKPFTYTFDREIGYGLKRGENSVSPRKEALVLLKKGEDGKPNIITSYPVNKNDK